MVILLSGGTRLARAAIASKLLEKHSKLRHLPMEEIASSMSMLGITGKGSEPMLLSLACECAHDMEKEKFSTIISCAANDENIWIFREQFPKKAIAIALVSKPGDSSEGYDVEADMKKMTAEHAANEISKILGAKK